jgi:hypothetical protein
LADDEHRVAAMDGIGEQCAAAGHAEVPECGRYDAFLDLLAVQPLHHETCRKKSLSDQADRQPGLVDIDVHHGSFRVIRSTIGTRARRWSHMTPTMSTRPTHRRLWMP